MTQVEVVGLAGPPPAHTSSCRPAAQAGALWPPFCCTAPLLASHLAKLQVLPELLCQPAMSHLADWMNAADVMALGKMDLGVDMPWDAVLQCLLVVDWTSAVVCRECSSDPVGGSVETRHLETGCEQALQQFELSEMVVAWSAQACRTPES